jgi:hypothetical protein
MNSSVRPGRMPTTLWESTVRPSPVLVKWNGLPLVAPERTASACSRPTQAAGVFLRNPSYGTYSSQPSIGISPNSPMKPLAPRFHDS